MFFDTYMLSDGCFLLSDIGGPLGEGLLEPAGGAERQAVYYM